MITELDVFREHFERYRAVTLQFLDIVPPEKLTWQPDDSTFTVGEHLQHIAQTEHYYRLGLLAILRSEPGGYRYSERDRRQFDQSATDVPDPNYFIDLVEPARYTTRHEPEDPTLEPSAYGTYALNLSHAAIGWAYFEKAAGILYWRDGVFQEFATAD